MPPKPKKEMVPLEEHLRIARKMGRQHPMTGALYRARDAMVPTERHPGHADPTPRRTKGY